FARLIRLAQKLQRNLIIVRETDIEAPERKKRRIDVWWGGERQNAGLMLAFGYLLQMSPEWWKSTLNIRTIVSSADELETARNRLDAIVAAGRIEAEVDVIVRDGGTSNFEVIREASREADMVFLGLRPPDPDEILEGYTRYYSQLLANTDGMPATALVLAAENIDFQRIFE
ncbi:MAG TPA: hypothetical protein VLC48_00560, partial [Gemmatimonadota bacterium]|nr:hypothetical protein [Gemmatimonadota bacterium]